jgi:hypothetical protein
MFRPRCESLWARVDLDMHAAAGARLLIAHLSRSGTPRPGVPGAAARWTRPLTLSLALR